MIGDRAVLEPGAEGSAATEAPAGGSNMAEEIRRMEYEPLLPVEKKLIGWSIGLGIALLLVLVWVSYTFFPGAH
jgi:hypothetical protein